MQYLLFRIPEGLSWNFVLFTAATSTDASHWWMHILCQRDLPVPMQWIWAGAVLWGYPWAAGSHWLLAWLGGQRTEGTLAFCSLNLRKFQHTCKFALFPRSFPITVWPTANTVFCWPITCFIHCTRPFADQSPCSLDLVVGEAEYMQICRAHCPLGFNTVPHDLLMYVWNVLGCGEINPDHWFSLTRAACLPKSAGGSSVQLPWIPCWGGPVSRWCDSVGHAVRVAQSRGEYSTRWVAVPRSVAGVSGVCWCTDDLLHIFLSSCSSLLR